MVQEQSRTLCLYIKVNVLCLIAIIDYDVEQPLFSLAAVGQAEERCYTSSLSG